MDEIFKKIYNKYIKKKNKFLLVILIYILYQTNFLISLIYSLGINLSILPTYIKMIILILNDLLYVFLLLFMFKEEIIKGLKKLKENFFSNTILSLNCWVVGSLIMSISSFLISLITKQDTSTNEALVRQSIMKAPIYMLFTCSIVAPILEEMTFRRALKGIINNKWIFIMTSGLIFGLLHVVGVENKTLLDYLYIIPYGSMGCCFAYLLSKTNNITLPILIHMIHNSILVLLQMIRG